MKVKVSSVKHLTIKALCGCLFFLLSSGAVFGQSTAFGTILNNANLRAGPATTYAITGSAAQGQTVTIIGQDESGAWYHLASGDWVAAFLVDIGLASATAGPSLTPTAVAEAGTRTPLLVPTAALTKTTPLLILIPTATPGVQSTPTPLPTVTSSALPASRAVTAQRDANLRGGPGTLYPVIGSVSGGQTLTLTGRNEDSSWFQLANGQWIAAFLVGDSPVAVATATPVTAPAVPTATPVPAPVVRGNDFVVIDKHLWDPYENGGSLDGPSVHCGLGRELIVNVVDANGNRLNGVAVQVQYGAKEIYVTGAQGKGDGVAEFVLGSGQDVKVVRDNDGRNASSDVATGLVTNAQFIPNETLIASKYCQDAASCKNFADTFSCEGHFSWTVTFKRQR